MEKTLIAEPCETVQVLPWLQRCMAPKADTTGGLGTLQDMCANAQAFRVTADGVECGAYAVIPMQLDRGVMLWIQAGAGDLPGVDLATVMAQAWELQAAGMGVKQVALLTKRPGLIRKLQAQGWQYAGSKMIKKVGA